MMVFDNEINCPVYDRYRVIDLLGQGTFGQVVKCERISNGQLYSVKVIKNKPAYRTQSRMEVEILKQVSVCGWVHKVCMEPSHLHTPTI